MSESILNQVKAITGKHLDKNPAEIEDVARFIEDLGADSLDVVELVMGFEEAFDIQIPDDEAEKIDTVKAAADYVEKASG